jgi:carbon-monoxide dehydrogenase large subunit
MGGIGQSVKRLEDEALLRGSGCFAADYRFPGMLHMRVVRAPLAFARILSIDCTEARAMPGVVAVWTEADIAGVPPIDFRQMRYGGIAPYRQHVLARDYVRYVGDPLAVVFAEDPYVAEDAAELVFADLEECPPHLDARGALSAFMPGVHEGLSSEACIVSKGYGDIEAAFDAAHAVVELAVSVGRHSGVPLETRGAVAVPDAATGRIVMHGASKVPHYNRNAISKMLALAPGQLELSEGHVGGGFGIRGELYPEDVLVCLAALRLGRSIRWIEDRREHMLAANHSRDQHYRMQAAVDPAGVIQGLKVDFITDQGAYVRTHGVTVTDLAAAMLPGPYVIPAYRANGHIRLTNKTPAGTYRAPGRYESSFARERLLDAIATRLSVDPVAVRRANLIPESAMPFKRGLDTLGTEVEYDSGRYGDLLDRALERFGYGEVKTALARRRLAGDLAGIGLAFFVEKSGLGPRDIVRMRMGADGILEIVTGVASIGQGVETVLAQIASETLGLPYHKIRVIHGQTALIEEGMGAFASRVTVMTGTAVRMAAEDLRARAFAASAALLQAEQGDLALRHGAVVSASGASIGLAELAAQLEASGGLTGEGIFAASHMVYPYGVHIAQVRIDPGTCGIAVERFIVAYEIGRSVNPMLVEGQIAGAAAQGIGGALLEEFVYDENGQPLAASFADYLMPTCHEVPEIECLVREDAPSPLNPLGVKGAGEGGITAAGAAIAAAIDDALGMPGAITELPVTPQRLHAILKSRR